MVAPAFVIVPLYIYPIAGSGAWNPLITSLEANPELNFQLVINPNSGPGAPPYPNDEFITAIAELNSYSNAKTICYVHTSYATRAIADVEADINTCAGWAADEAADIHMDGIFFDEAVAEYNSTTSAYMTSISSYARAALGSGRDTIILNPGIVIPDEFYDIADYVNVFEDSNSAYTTSFLPTLPTSVREKSTFMMYGFTGTAAEQTAIVDALAQAGLGGLFITTQTVYSAFSGLWTEFTSAASTA